MSTPLTFVYITFHNRARLEEQVGAARATGRTLVDAFNALCAAGGIASLGPKDVRGLEEGDASAAVGALEVGGFCLLCGWIVSDMYTLTHMRIHFILFGWMDG